MSWNQETNIRGPTGPIGPQGPQGPPGTSGAGTGNVTGPAGAIDNDIAVFNGTTGTLIKDGGTPIAALALKNYVDSQDALKAPLASPVFTGDPQAPTPATADNDTSVATTAFVKAQGYAASAAVPVPATATPLIESGAGNVGASAKYAREDHVHPLGGSGDVVGPAGAVADRIAVFNGTTGKLIKDGGQTIAGLPGATAVRYDTAQGLTAPQKLQARLNIATHLKGVLFDLTLSTPGASASFTVNSGEAADSTAADLMVLAAALTKTTSAWVAGAGGALDTGAITVATWYHVYLIKRPDTGVVDVLISLNPTAPTLPANYTLFRRIGSMHYTSTPGWRLFTQTGDEFLWSTTVNDLSGVTIGNTTRSLVPVTVPLGINVLAMLRVASGNVVSSSVIVTSPLETDQAPAIVGAAGITVRQTAAGDPISATINVRTDTSSRIGMRASAANVVGYISTYGYIDRRGRDS